MQVKEQKKRFNPNEHLMKIPKSTKKMEWQIVNGVRKQVEVWKRIDQDYLEVKWRLVWFREEHPDYRLITEIISADYLGENPYASVKCSIYFTFSEGDDGVISTGHGLEYKKNFENFLEKAETAAVGRALAQLGYGTQFAPELEDNDRIVDAPLVGKKEGQETKSDLPF